MTKYYKMMFLISTLVSTLITISSYSWLGMWLGLEINLISILPLLSKINSPLPSEAALKYFITQVMASLILLFSIITMMSLNPQFSKSISMILYSAIFTKMGMAPFHAWLPEVIEGLSWMNCLLMLTWQKIAPFIVLSNFLKPTLMILMIILTSALTGGLLGINQTSLRKIMAYSSINHMGWMLSSMLGLKTIWILYFMIYTLSSAMIIWLFKTNNLFYIKDMIKLLAQSKLINLVICLNLFSLGGLPPFVGFLPKWMVIYYLIQSNEFMISVCLILSSLITLFFYLQITFSALLLTPSTSVFVKKSKSLVYSLGLLVPNSLVLCTLATNWT